MIIQSGVEPYIPPLRNLPRVGSHFREMVENLGLTNDLKKCQEIHHVLVAKLHLNVSGQKEFTEQKDSIESIQSALKMAFPHYFVQHEKAEAALSWVEPFTCSIHRNHLRPEVLKEIKDKKRRVKKEKDKRVFIKRTGPRAGGVVNASQFASSPWTTYSTTSSTTSVSAPIKSRLHANVIGRLATASGSSSTASSTTHHLPTLAPPPHTGGSSSASLISTKHLRATKALPPTPGMTLEANLLPTLKVLLKEGYDCIEKIDELLSMSPDLQQMAMERLIIACQEAGGGMSFEILKVFAYIRQFTAT